MLIPGDGGGGGGVGVGGGGDVGVVGGVGVLVVMVWVLVGGVGVGVLVGVSSVDVGVGEGGCGVRVESWFVSGSFVKFIPPQALTVTPCGCSAPTCGSSARRTRRPTTCGSLPMVRAADSPGPIIPCHSYEMRFTRCTTHVLPQSCPVYKLSVMSLEARMTSSVVSCCCCRCGMGASGRHGAVARASQPHGDCV